MRSMTRSNLMRIARAISHRPPTSRLVRRLAEERGVAMVEFAILLPVLLVIVLGIFDFGMFLNYSNSETHLAEEAVRYAAVDTTPTSSQTIQAAVRAQAPPGLLTASSDVVSPVQVYLYFPSGSSNVVGQAVRACVTSQVHFFGLLGLADVTVTETAT